MQLPTIFRQGIISPLDDETESQFRSWSLSGLSMVMFLPIEGSDLSGELWDSGLFEAINTAAGSLIDEYEEELLEPGQLSLAVSAVECRISEQSSPEIRVFYERLLRMLHEARAAGRPVLFVL